MLVQRDIEHNRTAAALMSMNVLKINISAALELNALTDRDHMNVCASQDLMEIHIMVIYLFDKTKQFLFGINI